MTQAQNCCAEFLRAATVSRRRFLGGVAAAGATSVTTSLFGEAVQQASFGAEAGGNVVVVISFRGGIDGLGMVVPHGDPAYYAARPKIAVPKGQLIARDDMFGLHPHLAPLNWLWETGELAAVQAVGMSTPSRSHFAAMEAIEDAAPGSSLRQGWVNRMVGLDGEAVEALHVGSSTPPTLVLGPSPTLAVSALGEVELKGTDNGWGPRRKQQLSTMWGDDQGPLGRAARSALSAVETLSPVARSARPAVAYPADPQAADLAAALQDTARLVKGDLGTEVVSVDFGSWDMHDNYGNLDYGEMQKMTDVFARCVDAFMRDLGHLRSKVTLVTISEFGRRVAENGNRGLDHGWGNMMLLMGGGVKGGYHGNWPGLGTASLVEGDLKVTTDYRQVLGEVVHKRFPGKDVTQVFPGVSYAPLGVIRA